METSEDILLRVQSYQIFASPSKLCACSHEPNPLCRPAQRIRLNKLRKTAQELGFELLPIKEAA
jgi:hypothetical protein